MTLHLQAEPVGSGAQRAIDGAVAKVLPETMTMAELAADLQLSESTVRRMIQAGRVPGVVNIGGRTVRISRRIVAEWLGAVPVAG